MSLISRKKSCRAWMLPVALMAALPASWAQSNHLQHSLALLNQGNLDGAESEARLALDAPNTRSLALAMLGTIRLREHRYGQSESFLKRALQLDPHLVGARINLGETYMFEGKTSEAQRAFEDALRIAPGNANARLDLAQLETAQGEYQASLSTAQPIRRELQSSPEGILLLVEDDLALKKSEDAKLLLASWLAMPAQPAEASSRLGSLFMKSGMNREAVQVFEKAKSQGPAPFALAFDLADAYFAVGDLERAEENYQLALTLNPGCGGCDLGLARIAERQKNTEKALSFLIKARQSEPRNAEVLFEFGKVCLERDLVDDALPALKQAVALDPHRDSYQYVLASAHVAKKEYPAAATLLSELLRKHPDDAVLNYSMGAVRYLQVNYVEAESYLKKSIRLKPDQLAAYYYLGLTYERLDDDRAVDVFRKLLERYPSHAPSYVALGTMLLRHQKYAEAQQALEKAVQLDPQSVKAHYQLGMLLGRLGKTAESNQQTALARKLENDQRSRNEEQLRLVLPE